VPAGPRRAPERRCGGWLVLALDDAEVGYAGGSEFTRGRPQSPGSVVESSGPTAAGKLAIQSVSSFTRQHRWLTSRVGGAFTQESAEPS
jgi:hypothetical protein